MELIKSREIHYKFDGYSEYLFNSLSTLECSRRRHVSSVHNSGINSMDLDNSNRYLLSVNTRCEIYIHDIHRGDQIINAIASISRPVSHNFSITKCLFFPSNNDLLLTSSMDMSLKVWATKGIKNIHSFSVGSKVYTFDITKSKNEFQTVIACNKFIA